VRTLLVIAVLLALPAAARAQTGGQAPPAQIPGQVPTQVEPPELPVTPQSHPVQPTVKVGGVYDDNLFWQTDHPASDLVLRVSPGVSAALVRNKVTLVARYNLDAERYQDHPALTTAVASQAALFSLTGHPGPRTTLSGSAGFFSTLNPAEFNVSTGLTAGRVRTRRWQGGMNFAQTVTPRTRLEGGYEFDHDTIALGARVDTHAGGFQVAHDVGVLTELSLKFSGQRYQFGAGAGTPVSAYSVTVGVFRKIGTTAHVGFAAGPQWAHGQARPQVDFSIGRLVRFTDMTLSYGRGQTTAIGLDTPIEADHLDGRVSYDKPATIQLLVSGGLYWSRQAGNTARVYQVSGQVGKPLSRVVSFVVSYTLSLQRGGLGLLVSGSRRLERSIATVELTVSPWSVQ
jgi:hypothetical protein